MIYTTKDKGGTCQLRPQVIHGVIEHITDIHTIELYDKLVGLNDGRE